MAKGGPRVNSGRPAQPESRRLDRAHAKGQAPVLDDGEWLTLPREGRSGRAPRWPLTVASAREKTLWTRQWRRPQALAWERHGLDEQVALYVRMLARAEADGASTASAAEVRRLQDSLGLTAPGMRANRWRIAVHGGEQAATEPEQPVAGTAPAVRSPRERLKVVSDGTGG